MNIEYESCPRVMIKNKHLNMKWKKVLKRNVIVSI